MCQPKAVDDLEESSAKKEKVEPFLTLARKDARQIATSLFPDSRTNKTR
jgi:hypothetical protein